MHVVHGIYHRLWLGSLPQSHFNLLCWSCLFRFHSNRRPPKKPIATHSTAYAKRFNNIYSRFSINLREPFLWRILMYDLCTQIENIACFSEIKCDHIFKNQNQEQFIIIIQSFHYVSFPLLLSLSLSYTLSACMRMCIMCAHVFVSVFVKEWKNEK